ncbi:hypothetical protein SBA3_4260018 [Candidatus Sulfopaludibacter sp. SbA3]|nr:hypothetical protein SBA3_4260018 [Candidatus Sulfopaludibacter sp. SbA3]
MVRLQPVHPPRRLLSWRANPLFQQASRFDIVQFIPRIQVPVRRVGVECHLLRVCAKDPILNEHSVAEPLQWFSGPVNNEGPRCRIVLATDLEGGQPSSRVPAFTNLGGFARFLTLFFGSFELGTVSVKDVDGAVLINLQMVYQLGIRRFLDDLPAHHEAENDKSRTETSTRSHANHATALRTVANLVCRPLAGVAS